MPEPIVPPVDGGGEKPPVPTVDPMAEVKALIGQLKGSIDNVKHEFNRKLDSRFPAPPAPTKKPLQELMYDNPEEAVTEIANSIESRITSRLEERDQNRSTAQKLYSDYPELTDPGNPLSVRANEIFTSLPERDQKDPRALRTAVLEAASEIGLAPKPKRKQIVAQDDDNFQLGGGARPARKKSSDQLDPGVLEAAAALGLNVDDPKVVARLKQRTAFKKYE